MSKKRFGIVGVVAAAAIAVSGLVAPTAYAVDKEITVWADETRGPNLKKVFETKGDWVSGYTVKVTTFQITSSIFLTRARSTEFLLM